MTTLLPMLSGNQFHLTTCTVDILYGRLILIGPGLPCLIVLLYFVVFRVFWSSFTLLPPLESTESAGSVEVGFLEGVTGRILILLNVRMTGRTLNDWKTGRLDEYWKN